jgi:hypothetical protein
MRRRLERRHPLAFSALVVSLVLLEWYLPVRWLAKEHP